MKSARSSPGELVPVNLQEVYTHTGDFSIKMLIDPKASSSIMSVDATISTADGTLVPTDVHRWGTKLTLSFTISDNVPDGVATIDVLMAGRGGSNRQRFAFWIIK